MVWFAVLCELLVTSCLKVKGYSLEPDDYEAWYHTPHGRWIAEQETNLLQHFLDIPPGTTLLDVGCGTGHFSRRMAASGLHVVGLDKDVRAVSFATMQDKKVDYMVGNALSLPFPDHFFDHAMAVTSLCLIAEPASALLEMMRVTRHAVVLGLLNRHSLLYYRKAGRGGYEGARWDSLADVQSWIETLSPACRYQWRMAGWGTTIHIPIETPPARWAERLLPWHSPWGGFLVVKLVRKTQ